MPSKTNNSDKVINLRPSTFETIDKAVLKWVDEKLNLYATTNDGWKKVPVVWITAERAFQMKHKKEMRSIDSAALIFPLMTIERNGVTKTPSASRPIPGNIFPKDDYRKGSFFLTRKINQNKTRNFANKDRRRVHGKINFPNKDQFGRKIKNEKIVYTTMTVPMPVYYDIEYSINLRADYQQQMNEMMQPFMVYTGGINQFKIEQDRHKYEAFIEDSYSMENNAASLGEEEKKYETVVKIKVLGYILGADKNQDTPHVVIRENPVEIRFQRDRVMLEDINEFGSEKLRSL